MQIKQFAVLSIFSASLISCGGGDINIQPSTSNDDNSVIGDNNDFSVSSGGVSETICASYELDGEVISGDLLGADCFYGTDFVDFDNPLMVDVTIPFIGADAAHIFQGSLWVGESFDTLEAAAAAGITQGGDGPTLTVEAGVTIAHQTNDDFMVINRGSQIQAIGTPSAPITFTSQSDIPLGSIGDPEAVSQWGGMVINGFGVTNGCDYMGVYPDLTLIGDCSRDSEGSEGEQANSYGGVNNADSSGTLQYVVVKHTGAEVANGDELNGVTFSGVGSGTTVSFLQAYSTFDDGIEFFGGAVNVDHYVGLYVNDDSIDFDEGYRGTIEYALVIQAADDGNRCVEGDGVGSHSEMRAANAVAQNLNGQPVIENLTCILSGESTLSQGGTGTRDDPSQGLRLREGLFPVIRNALITSAYLGDRLLNDDDSNYCLRVDNGQTIASVAQNDGNVLIESSIFACQDLVDGQSGTPEGGAEVTLTEDDLLAFLANNNSQAFQTDELGQDPSADVQNGLEILDGFFSLPLADMLIDGVAPTITAFDRGTGETPFVGAVQSSNDWTAGWAYGLEEGNQGQPLYFEE